jgi:hypothetical protein
MFNHWKRGLGLLGFMLFISPVMAQNTTGLTTTTCGRLSSAFGAGLPAPFTVDVNGDLCSNGAGMSTYVLEPTASDNHANIKNGAGSVYSITTYSKIATLNYIRLYNAANGFNGCNSATNLVWEGNIPGATTGVATSVNISGGIYFSTGISICVTGAYGQTDTTNASASSISVNIGYK